MLIRVKFVNSRADNSVILSNCEICGKMFETLKKNTLSDAYQYP